MTHRRSVASLAVVHQHANEVVLKHVLRAADVVGVGMRQPENVDAAAAEALSESPHEAGVRSRTRSAATWARRTLARVDENHL